MLIKGQWHAPGSAAQFEAALRLDGDEPLANNEYQLVVLDGPSFAGRIDDLTLSDRLGNVGRKITLENNSVFITQDNAAVDAWLTAEKVKGQSRLSAILHTIESNMALVLVSIILTIVTTISFFKWGVPWASTKIAHALPHKANELISAHTLDFLDDYFFDQSELGSARQDEIRNHFQAVLVPLASAGSQVTYSLHFRKWGEGEDSIPNAFALPAGDIILTDRFVEISQSQQEIDAVLLHEMGHVEYRHTLETVVEGTMLATVLMMVTGDSNGLADMGVGLGSLLVTSNYSRDNESEADLYAFQKMLLNGMDPDAFARIMQRITDDIETPKPKNDEPDETGETLKQDSTSLDEQIAEAKTSQHEQANPTAKPTTSSADKPSEEGLLDYLSSHPSTAERIAQAKQFSQCFKQGKRICEPSLID